MISLLPFCNSYIVTQSEQDRSCILLVQMQRCDCEFVWVHVVLQVRDSQDANQQPVIVCTNQVLRYVVNSIWRLIRIYIYKHNPNIYVLRTFCAHIDLNSPTQSMYSRATASARRERSITVNFIRGSSAHLTLPRESFKRCIARQG